MLSVGSSRKPTLELFPFISLFLCVIGVLAFLQNLLVVGDIGASEEEAQQPQIFQTAYSKNLPDSEQYRQVVNSTKNQTARH